MATGRTSLRRVGIAAQRLRAQPSLLLVLCALFIFSIPLTKLGHDFSWLARVSCYLLAAGALLVYFNERLGGSQLILDADGFTVMSFWRKRRYAWQNVGSFRLWRFKTSAGTRAERVVVESRGGRRGTIPGTYGMHPAELLTLLERHRRDALERAAGTGSSSTRFVR